MTEDSALKHRIRPRTESDPRHRSEADQTAIGRTIASHRDWRIDTANPEKSVVFLNSTRPGGALAVTSGDSDKGARYMPAFFALSSSIEGWMLGHAGNDRRAQKSFELSSFAIQVQGVRCRVQRVQDTRYHVRVPATLLPLSKLGMPDTLKTMLLSRDLDSGGLIIASGGYGSGKTNTVNAVVRERISRNGGYGLMLGAPIEYELSGFHGNSNAPGYIEQVDLMGNDMAAEIRASMRSFPSGPTSILGYPELIRHDGVGEMLRAANRGNLVFVDMHASNIEAAILNMLSMANQDGEMYARELLGNCLRLVVHQTMTLMPDSMGVHVTYKHVRIGRAIRSAILDVGMPLSKVLTQTIATEMSAAGTPV